jgi:hypothetical protein
MNELSIFRDKKLVGTSLFTCISYHQIQLIWMTADLSKCLNLSRLFIICKKNFLINLILITTCISNIILKITLDFKFQPALRWSTKSSKPIGRKKRSPSRLAAFRGPPAVQARQNPVPQNQLFPTECALSVKTTD